MEKLLGLLALLLALYFVVEGVCVAWMTFLILGLILVFRPPRLLTFSDSNGIYGEVPSPDKPAREGIKVYGQKETLEDCQDACLMDLECKGFVWDSNVSPDPWSHYCYGKTESPFTYTQGWYSGVKLA